MSDIFQVNQNDLKKLQKFFRDSPRDFRQATAGILNSLAFQKRKNDIQNLSGNMIIRNRKFLENSLKVQTTVPRNIENQIAYEGSIIKEGFTGWKEQQDGTSAPKHRAGSLYSRGGNRAGVMSKSSRLNNKKIMKLSQFSGKDNHARFMFMLRILGSRGGGQFLLSDNIKTNSGALGKGLYQLTKFKRATKKRKSEGGNIKRLQQIGNIKQPKRFHWSNISIDQLHTSNDIKRIWQEQLNRIINKYNK